MVNQQKGDYTVQLMNTEGKVLSTQIVSHQGDNSSEIIQFGKTLSGGMYQVSVLNPENIKTTEKVLLLI